MLTGRPPATQSLLAAGTGAHLPRVGSASVPCCLPEPRWRGRVLGGLRRRLTRRHRLEKMQVSDCQTRPRRSLCLACIAWHTRAMVAPPGWMRSHHRARRGWPRLRVTQRCIQHRVSSQVGMPTPTTRPTVPVHFGGPALRTARSWSGASVGGLRRARQRRPGRPHATRSLSLRGCGRPKGGRAANWKAKGPTRSPLWTGRRARRRHVPRYPLGDPSCRVGSPRQIRPWSILVRPPRSHGTVNA
jgi:hypothetical protein